MTKNIYTLLNILIIGAIIFTGVDTFMRVFEAKLEQPAFDKPSAIKKTSPVNRNKIKRLRDYEVINRRSIFGKTAQDDSGSTEEPPDLANLEPANLNNISLMGTAVTGRENSIAIISVKSKRPPQDTYRIGDSVEGALIKNILRNKVILNINGEDKILIKEEEPTRAGTSSSPITRETAVRASTPVPTRSIQLDRAEMEKELSDLQNLLTQASIKPHYTNGEPDGLAITGVQSRSVFRRIGLRNGDIVKSVEGNDIRSPEDLISLYNDLQSEDTVSFQVIRRGRERTINLNFR